MVSVGKRPGFPVVADANPDSVQPEGLEDQERYEEQSVQHEIELREVEPR